MRAIGPTSGLLAALAALAAAGAVPQLAVAQGSTTLCHATGNPSAPYVEITVGPAGPGPHANHPDDIIPAPAGGCPTAAQATPTPTPTSTPTPNPVQTPVPVGTPAPTGTPPYTITPAPADTPSPLSATPEAAPDEPVGSGTTPGQGGGDDDGPPPLSDTLPSAPAGAAPLPAGTLPVTGTEPLLVAMIGLGFLMIAAGLRLGQRTAGAANVD